MKREMINTKYHYFSYCIPFPNDISTLEPLPNLVTSILNSLLQTHSDIKSERNLCKIFQIVAHFMVTCLTKFKFSGKDNFE